MTTLCRVFLNIVAVGAAGLIFIASAQAQDSAPAAPTVSKTAAPAAAPAEAQPGKLRGRLPPGYADVCDDAQRQAIYAIQAEYAKAIAELEAKLAQVRAERDGKIEAVLKPEQLEKVKAAREAAREKRRKTSGMSAEPAPPAPPKAPAGTGTATDPAK